MNIRELWKRTTGSNKTEQPCPLPDVGYDFWRGDLDLTNVVESSVDRELRSFLTRFAASPEDIRTGIRARIRPEQFSDLKWHALRSAVLAIRNADAKWVQSGVSAIAAIDWKRLAPSFWTLELAFLYHAGVIIAPAEVDGQFLRAVSLADRGTAEIISNFLRLSPEEKRAQFTDSEAEIQTDAGVGFVLRRSAMFNPTYDLKKLVTQMRQIVASDQYEPFTVSIGDVLDDQLVRKHSAGPDRAPYFERGTALADALRSIRGGAGVFGRLRPARHPHHGHCYLDARVFECGDHATAAFLSARFQNNGLGWDSTSVTCGPLLCLVQAFVTPPAVERYETLESMRRFERPFIEVLAQADRPFPSS